MRFTWLSKITMKPNIKTLTKTVSDYFNVPLRRLFMKDRHRDIVDARRVCWIILSETFRWPHYRIADRWHVDRTTVTVGIIAFKELSTIEHSMVESVAEIIKKVKNSVDTQTVL